MEPPIPFEEFVQKPPVVRRSRWKTFGIISLLLIVIGLVIGVYQVALLSLRPHPDDAAAAAQARERARLTSALGVLGISPASVAQGFWYTYVDAEGNEHVLFFDPAVQGALSDDELLQLTEILGKSRITEKSSMRVVPAEELPSALRFHNAIYSFGARGKTTLDMKRALVQKSTSGAANADDLFQLSYLQELEGNYRERDRLDRENCSRFKERCADASRLTVKGRVVDDKGAPVQGARVEIVSRPDAVPASTDSQGFYRLETGAKAMEKLRLRASKRNYSDGNESISVVSGDLKIVAVDDIVLESPLTVVTVDFAKKTITGAGNRITERGAVVTTPNSTYEIPPDAIVTANGSRYRGTIDIYVYEFTKDNPPESLLNVDTFDEIMGYAGDLMKTFGMPYIQFFAEDGTELHVRKSNPMVLTYRIPEMDALRENEDGIYEPLTDDDMELLVAASVGQPYRIDREFLINNHLLRFPAFWVFDRKRGVWDNVGVTVVDTQGTIRTTFYTIRDDS